MVLSEIKYLSGHLRNLIKPQRVPTNLVNFPSRSYTLYEPLGVVLIIAPWNYPFQLLMNPLVGAIAAGNCVVLKPSEHAPATAAVMQLIISKAFAQAYISYYPGDGAAILPEMLTQYRFDHVFYTGSTTVGKLIYQQAAEKLVPVTLELGGKSPCLILPNANLKVAAQRIVSTKYSNCGQMCVAPDYVLAHSSIAQELIKELIISIEKFYTTDPSTSYDYGKIINTQQYNRLIALLSQGTIAYGGNVNREKLYIQPTLLTNVTMKDSIMQQEIFGPLLPILTYTTDVEAKAVIAQNPNPLALYVFSSNKADSDAWLHTIAFGGGCANNAAVHLLNHRLPFGGRGYSGSGAYHGKYSFATFSHRKALQYSVTWLNPSITYPSFKGKLKWFKRLLG